MTTSGGIAARREPVAVRLLLVLLQDRVAHEVDELARNLIKARDLVRSGEHLSALDDMDAVAAGHQPANLALGQSSTRWCTRSQTTRAYPADVAAQPQNPYPWNTARPQRRSRAFPR